MCPSVFQSWFLSVRLSVSVSVCQSVSLSVCQSVSSPVSQSVCVSVCQSVCSSVCQSVCSSVSQSLCMSVTLSVSLSVCPSCSVFRFSVGPSCCVSLACCVCLSLVSSESSVQPCSLLLLLSSQRVAQGDTAQNSENKTWHCEPCCHCNCYNRVTCCIGGKYKPNHLQSYDCRPMRARRIGSDVGHASWKERRERGRALLGPVVSWMSESDKWSHPKYGLSGKFAGLKSLPLFRVHIDGGTLGPRVRYSPGFEFTFKLQGAGEGIGHFRCTNPASVNILPRTTQQKKAIRASHGEHPQRGN